MTTRKTPFPPLMPLAALREALNLTPVHAALLCGIKPRRLARIEARRSAPQFEELSALLMRYRAEAATTAGVNRLWLEVQLAAWREVLSQWRAARFNHKTRRAA